MSKSADKHYLTEKQDYYVYELIDPRTDKVFYVGKGQGNRVYEHVKKIKRNSKHTSNTEKNSMISEILDSGLEVVENIKMYFDTQDEAIEYEMELIGEHGIENLTNIHKRGHTQEYKKYPFENFRNNAKLIISILARCKSMRIDKISKYAGVPTASEVYEATVREYQRLSKLGGYLFTEIVNQEIESKWKGAQRCMN